MQAETAQLRRAATVLQLLLSFSGGNPNSTFCSFVNLALLRRQKPCWGSYDEYITNTEKYQMLLYAETFFPPLELRLMIHSQ